MFVRGLMKKKDEIIKQAASLAHPLCEQLGVTLYDVDFYKEGADYTLCFLIDKIGGVFIEDCEAFSRAIDPLLDENDVVDCQYCLEVSSCGADRKLSKPEHYKTAIGERIKLNFFTKIDGVKTTVGVLKEYTAESITLEVNGEEKIYNKKDISSAKIDIDYDKLFS